MEKRFKKYFFQFYLFLILDILVYFKPEIFGLDSVRANLFLPVLVLGEISLILLQESYYQYKLSKKYSKLANELFLFLMGITTSLKKGVTNFITLFYYTDTNHFSKDFQKEIKKLRKKVNILGTYKAFKELIDKWSIDPNVKAIKGPFLSILKTQQFNSLTSLIDAVRIKREINEIISSEMTEMKIMLIGGSIMLSLFPPVFRKISGYLPTIYFYYIYFMIFSFIIFIGGAIVLVSTPERANRIRIITFLFVVAVLSYSYLVLTTPITQNPIPVP